MRKSFTLILTALLIVDVANAATPKPLPSLVVPGASNVHAKSSKPVVKRVARHRYVRRVVKPIPSPAPKWPPVNFVNSGSIYAKIPSANELRSFASNSKDLTKDLADCEKFTCGAVFLSSEIGCNWWQIDSMVTAPSKTTAGGRDTLGTLHTLANGSDPKKIIAVLLKSTEPLATGVSVNGITARCWSTAKPDGVPSNTYAPVPSASPSTN